MKSLNSITRKQGGFTLIEILLVIGIIAILAIAAFVIFPQVQAASRANNEQNNISTVAAGVKNLYGSAGNYDTVTNDVVNVARIFPASMNGGVYATGTAITSAWGGTVTVAEPAAGSKNFTITYTAVPAAVCTKLIPAVATNFDQVDMVNGTPSLALSTVKSLASPTLNVGLMVTDCASSPDMKLTSS